MLLHNIFTRHVRVRRLADSLAEDGHYVDVISLASDDGADQSRPPFIKCYTLSKTRSRHEGLGHVMDWASTVLSMLYYTNRLDLKNHYDLVHVHNMPDFLVFTAVIQRLAGKPVLLHIGDPMPELGQSKLNVGPDHILIRGLGLLEQASCRFSTHVITALDSFKEQLIMRGTPADKITVIMNAPDSRLFSPQILEANREKDPEHYVVLYVGTVATRYGLETMVKALPILRERIPNIKFKIVPKIKDEGKGLDDCYRLSEELGVRSLLEVVDPVAIEKMPAVMASADVGVYPAIRNRHMDWALSLKIPEMALAKLPMVSSRLTVLEQLYGDESIAFYDSEDYEGLAAKIVQIHESSSYRLSLINNAYLRASQNDWSHQYSVYKDLLSKLLGRPV
ncbi:MAG: glycosyltransferase family 4 protein [Syntrophaceae bacterium]|nr:glycosyltransferase family 4 protein [Syntrophaceae bacterium]